MQEEIIGHKRIIEYFKLISQMGRLSSFYLFIGKEGIGKRKVAKFIAYLVNCREPEAPCFRCPNCLSISKGISPDIIEVSPQLSFLGIEEVREIQRRLYLKNFSLPYKVVIIDKVEKFTPEASDAFLKVLEEPPPQTLIILITSQPHLISSTLNSRAQKMHFRLSSQEARKILAQVSTVNGDSEQSFGEPFFEELLVLGNLYEGSLSFLEKKDLLSLRRQLLKAPLGVFFEQNSLFERSSLKEAVFFLIYFLRDSLFFKGGYFDRIINVDFKEKIEAYSQRFSFEAILDKIKSLLEIYQSLDNININLAKNLIRTIIS